jgi:Na+/H+-dicarboxylate symporter
MSDRQSLAAYSMLMFMKVWLKFIIGSVLGVILGFLLPQENQTIMAAMEWLNRFAIQIGRYVVVPILLFALVIAIYELRQDGQLWKMIFKTFLAIIICTTSIVVLGILVTNIFPPARIPILIEEQQEIISLDVKQGLFDLFPSNMFTTLTSGGIYLLPLCVFALFLGIGLSYDKNYTKPVISLIDSLSRIFYHIASFFSEILGFVIIILGAYWAIRFRGALQADVYRDIILLLGVFSVVLSFGILPLGLYLLKPKVNPWIILYGSLAPSFAAFFSGDINFSIPVLLRHTKENLGIQRRSNTIVITLFTNFGRAGSAMVAAVAFVLIIRSYSSLQIPMETNLYIIFHSILISFFIARHPGDGAFTVLAVLCIGFGRGFEAGYLILKPIAFYLIAIGTFVDITLTSFASYVISRISGFQEDKDIRHFI